MVVAKVNQAAYDRLERACPFLVKNTSTPPKFVPGNVVQPEKKWPSFLRPVSGEGNGVIIDLLIMTIARYLHL